MKRKIISILLIFIILTISLPIINIPVNAKLLDDLDENWQGSWHENWIDIETEDIIEYATLDDYLNAHYIDYANIDKSQITRLFIEGFKIYDIKDLSGLYDFPNLTELEIWDPVNQDAIKALDFTKLTNLRELALYNVDISNIELNKLTNLTYLSIQGDYGIINSTLNLNNMKNLKYFYYNQELTSEEMLQEDTESTISQNIKDNIIPLEGYELYIDIYRFEMEDGGTISCKLAEELNVNISTDKNTYKLGDKVTTTVSWDKGMQATDFEINFDSSKLKLEGSTLDEDYYKLVAPGRILVSWASPKEIDVQVIGFEFSAIGDGQAEILVLPENFADGDLDSEYIFTEGRQVITIERSEYIKPDKEIITTQIDNKDTITGLNITKNNLTVGDFLKQDNFSSDVEVKVFNDKNEQVTDNSKGLGTGSKVKLFKEGNMIKEFTVVMYGDTTGDGKINPVDALTLIKAINQINPYKGEIYKEAGRIMTASGKEPKPVDALAIVKSANYLYTINQSK